MAKRAPQGMTVLLEVCEPTVTPVTKPEWVRPTPPASAETVGPACWLTAYAYGPLTPPLWKRWGTPVFDFEDAEFVSRHDAEQYFSRHHWCYVCGKSGWASRSAQQHHDCRIPPKPVAPPKPEQLSLF